MDGQILLLDSFLLYLGKSFSLCEIQSFYLLWCLLGGLFGELRDLMNG